MPSILLSDNGVSSGSAGIKTTGGNDGVLALQTTTSGGTATTAVTIDTSQNVGIGTSSPNAYGAGYTAETINNTTGAVFDLNLAGTRTATFYALSDGTIRVGSQAAYPLQLITSGTERMRIDTSGNVLVTGGGGLGYGTGSGGTVTQATSKSTGVTLNKTTGQITMNNAALAAGATIGFIFSNSLAGSADTLLLTGAGGAADWSTYQFWTTNFGGGSLAIYVKNQSGGSLSEAIKFNFAIIKGATA